MKGTGLYGQFHCRFPNAKVIKYFQSSTCFKDKNEDTYIPKPTYFHILI
jgi:hypothetical protein